MNDIYTFSYTTINNSLTYNICKTLFFSSVIVYQIPDKIKCFNGPIYIFDNKHDFSIIFYNLFK